MIMKNRKGFVAYLPFIAVLALGIYLGATVLGGSASFSSIYAGEKDSFTLSNKAIVYADLDDICYNNFASNRINIHTQYYVCNGKIDSKITNPTINAYYADISCSCIGTHFNIRWS